MASKEDLYIILDIRRTASVNEIKKAFRKLARRFHPDINPGDRQAEDRFKRITEAYEILSNPLKRQFYDVNGFYSDGVLDPHTAQSSSSWGFRFQGFNFSHSGEAASSEFFGRLFGGQAIRRDPERGEDLEHSVSTSFDESIQGLKRRISVLRKLACMVCGASGLAPGSRESGCGTCGGSGKATRATGHLRFAVTCVQCGGTGRNVQTCRDCGGESRVSGAETLDVDLPPGITTGSRIRIPGKGNAGRFGGPNGDLYVVANTAPHPFFNRVGDNVHCTIPLTVTEAALGTKVEVPTITGPAIVRIPPGTQTGQTFRLRGKGAPSLRNPGMRGDQYVEVRIVVPRVADERSKAILRELAKLNPENPRRELWK